MSEKTPAERMKEVKELISEADSQEEPEAAEVDGETELEPESAEPEADDQGEEDGEDNLDDDAYLLTFEEMVVDRLLEEEDGPEMLPVLIEEMAYWIEITDDQEALERAAQVIAGMSDGLQVLVSMLAEKLPEG